MTLVIGTDEAGYGPALGPLVVAATAWRVAASPDDAEAVLERAVAAAVATGGPAWADSKQVYRAGAGFAALERGALVGVALATEATPENWPSLARALGPISPPSPRGGWERLGAVSVTASDPETKASVGAALARHGVVLERIVCRGIYPAEFNALLATGANKSDVLSQATLDLAADLRSTAASEPTLVWCDRHGGRKRYGGLVARHFDTPLVEAREETPERSVYVVPPTAGVHDSCRVEFCVGGEARAPVALASMAAKYVRELAMQAFNDFWCRQADGLNPTAGYPVDAARWRRDAAAAILATGTREDDLWRRA
jgi:hypothetical protein